VALIDRIPTMTRSHLHRFLQRNVLNVMRKYCVEKQAKQAFKDYEVGYLHVSITHILLENNPKLYLFVGLA
jgi:hypothetical protein